MSMLASMLHSVTPVSLQSSASLTPALTAVISRSKVCTTSRPALSGAAASSALAMPSSDLQCVHVAVHAYSSVCRRHCQCASAQLHGSSIERMCRMFILVYWGAEAVYKQEHT
jgi:hypothetical protein